MTAKSAAATSKSSPRLAQSIVNSPRATRARIAAAETPPAAEPALPAPEIPAVTPIVASAIQLVPFRDLKRAPENVRHIRRDEDVEPLADDIAAHGLLQSLIGYRALDDAHRTPVERVWIVGGGRRLQALGILVDRFAIDLDFPVPVLIRDRAEAVELSLTENLQKRDMSPVDECRAFVTLMAPGTTSPADLAKRFGFSEVYVRQRLRLAELAEPILDALAEKKITIASAMAYAASSDPELQLAVFRQQEKTSWEKHAVHRVKADYAAAQLTTSSGLFQFVGADAYEAAGGGYEDDLFGEDRTASGGRKLTHGPLLKSIGARLIEERSTDALAEIRKAHPSVASVLVPPGLAIVGHQLQLPKTPARHAKIEPDYSDRNTIAKIWKRIDEGGVPAIAIIGLTSTGELTMLQRTVFVPNDVADQVKLETRSGSTYTPPSPEEIEREQVAKAIDLKQWRLGVGSFVGTPLEGRAFWPRREYGIQAVEADRDPKLQDGRLVTVQIFVTNEQHDLMREEAKLRVEEDRAAAAPAKREKEERAARHGELIAGIVALDPPPAVIVIDGEPFYRRADGEWADDAAEIEDEDKLGVFPGIASLLGSADAGDPIEHFASIEAYRATLTDAGASKGASA